jgi:hypothetical protein
MRRFTLILIASGLYALPVMAAPAPHPPTLYERLADKLERNPKLAEGLGKPAPEMNEVAWLVGEWDITAKVFATRKEAERVSQGRSKVAPAFGGVWLQFTDTYGNTSPDLSFLTFSPSRRKWVSATIDDSTNAVITTAESWNANHLVFTGPPVEIMGEIATLRQTMEKISDREYRVLNEEHLADGSWVPVDEYRYKKR